MPCGSRCRPEKKARIGKYAADMVQNGDTIAICAGTTTFHMAAGLADKKDVTVLTNDIAIAAQIAALEGCRLIVVGGMLKDDSMTLVGMFAESMLKELHVTRCSCPPMRSIRRWDFWIIIQTKYS